MRSLETERMKSFKEGNEDSLFSRKEVHNYFVPNGMPVLNKINKVKGLFWAFNLKMKNIWLANNSRQFMQLCK